MGYIVRMPKLGLEMEQGTLLEWYVGEGEAVSEGDVLAEIESEKSIGEVEGREEGVLAHVLVSEGDTVPPGSPIGVVGGQEEDVAALVAEAESELGEEGATDEGTEGDDVEATASDAESAAGTAAAGADAGDAVGVKASPRAKRRAEELGVDLVGVEGSGPQGAVTEDDVEAAAESGGAASVAEEVKASPRAKRRAEELGIDLAGVEGTGPQGAVTEGDVEAAAESGGEAVEAGTRPGGVRRLAPDPGYRYACETAVADAETAEGLLAATESVRRAFEADVSVTDVLLAVASATLAECPAFNATFAESTHQYHEAHHVAVVTTDGETAVVADAAHLSLSELVETRAAGGDDERPTFTLANGADFDGEGRLVNPPCVATLEVNPERKRAVPSGEGVDLRPLVTATLTYDTRAVDAVDAAAFLDRLFDHVADAPAVVLGTYRGE